MKCSRRGTVLLEVVVAVTILAIAGTALVITASQTAESLRTARERDREMLAASAFLDAVVLWPRADLDRRLGERTQGPWRMYLSRTSRTLYTVTLTDTVTGAALLRTEIYKPVDADASP